jgi:hypothetical protein
MALGLSHLPSIDGGRAVRARWLIASAANDERRLEAAQLLKREFRDQNF